MKILVVGTLTVDKIIKEDKIMIKAGGPGFFISKVFSEFNLNYSLISFLNPKNKNLFKQLKNLIMIETQKTPEILIRINEDGEEGRIISFPKKYDTSQIPLADIYIISTVFEEVSLDVVKELKSRGAIICLDVQGFVRDPHVFGSKKMWDQAKEYFIYCDIIRMNKKELECIPKEALELAKTKLLLISKNDKIVVYYKNNMVEVGFTKINCYDTIGAGDTFFASFINFYLINEETIMDSLKKSINLVKRFLKTKE